MPKKPTSNMSVLQYQQEIARRFGIWSENNVKPDSKLPKGFWAAQRETIQTLAANPHMTMLNVETPTGTGKTILAGAAYCILRHANRINRALVIVPTTEQRRQYASDFSEQISFFGETVRGVISVDGSDRIQTYHRTNRAEIFVATIQLIASHPDIACNLMESGAWMLVADEHHHYGIDRPWGDALKNLAPSFTLAISATPLRGDRQYSIYGKPDIYVPLETSLREREIRPIRGHIEHYFVDVSVEDSDEIIRITTEWLRNREGKTGEIEDYSKYEIKRGIRYHSKYLSSILPNALACLQRKRIKYPNEHQMIVFCMSCKHAKHVSENFAYIGKHLDISTDWIGSGPDGRKDEENSEVIKKFKDGKLDVLVQVDKAGEGFNVKKASVLVFLNLIGRTPKAQQQIGRGMRRNGNISYEDDYCDVFVSYDTQIADLVTEMEERQEIAGVQAVDQDELDIKVEKGIKLLRFPKWAIIDVQYDRTEIVTPWEIEQAMSYVVENADLAENPGEIRVADKDDLKKAIEEVLIQKKKIEISLDERIAQARSGCKNRLGLLIRNITKILTCGKYSYDRTMYGELAPRINAAWIRWSGLRTDSMTEDEFKEKAQWLNEINEQIIEDREVPSWLKL